MHFPGFLAVRTLQTNWFHPKYEYDDAGMQLPAPFGSFTEIEVLELTNHLPRVTAFLEGRSFKQLRRIGVRSTLVELEQDLSDFCLAVADPAPTLQEIRLHLYIDVLDARNTSSLVDLRPLMACSQLEFLAVHHFSSTTLLESDFYEMGSARPNLTFLCLCPNPNMLTANADNPGTSFHALVAVPACRTSSIPVSSSRRNRPRLKIWTFPAQPPKLSRSFTSGFRNRVWG